jgi:hypothetical protein
MSGEGRLLDLVAGRTGVAVTSGLDARGQCWNDQVKFVALPSLDGCDDPRGRICAEARIADAVDLL